MLWINYYYIVGGMPEAVSKWAETHNFEQVEKWLADAGLIHKLELVKNPELPLF